PCTPAAAIQSGTLPEQRSVVVSLSDLPRAVNEAQLGSPAILVIGEVVKFARTAAQSDASALSDLIATVA
ncbi:MAG TPA: uroporphyrinogen-III C-methyltransferase, partial [Burkholderiales bacterium]|nr:uroporphyrinogen-III C-methyltransferase [Burkholderiales bacterium]